MTVSAPVVTTTSRQLLGLAGADVGRRVGRVASLDEGLEDLRAGRLGEGGELPEAVLGVGRGAVGPDADEDDAFEADLAVLDLGDVLELGREAGDPAERLTLLEDEGPVVVAQPVLGVGRVSRVHGRRIGIHGGGLSHRESRVARRPTYAEPFNPPRFTVERGCERFGSDLPVSTATRW